MGRHRRGPWALVACGALGLWPGGCDGCGGSASVRVGGDHPFARCMARGAAPPSSTTLGAGPWPLELDGPRARFADQAPAVDLLVAAGPAPGEMPEEPVDALPFPALDPSAPRPRVVLLLGGLGEDPAAARRTLKTLARGAPDALLVVVPGGRDTLETLRLVSQSADPGELGARVMDGSRRPVLTVGAAHELVFVAGAPDGRYARDAEACGHVPDDLDRLARRLGGHAPDGRARWLVSWAAPAGAGAVSGDGVDAGSADLAAMERRIGARGGIHTWPTHAARLPDAAGPLRHLTVPRVAGPAHRRADGALVPPGWTLVSLGPDGAAEACALTPGG